MENRCLRLSERKQLVRSSKRLVRDDLRLRLHVKRSCPIISPLIFSLVCPALLMKGYATKLLFGWPNLLEPKMTTSSSWNQAVFLSWKKNVKQVNDIWNAWYSTLKQRKLRRWFNLRFNLLSREHLEIPLSLVRRFSTILSDTICSTGD